MKRAVAGVIILTLLGVLLAPPRTALASSSGSFTINDTWVWTYRDPAVLVTISPPAGMTRCATRAVRASEQPPTFADEDFMDVGFTTFAVPTSEDLLGYDGLIKVWVQYATAAGERSDLIEHTVPAYSWLFFQVQDASGTVASLFTEPGPHDKALTVQVNMGGWGQGPLPAGQWALSLTNPYTHEVVTFPVVYSTHTAQVTVPGRFIASGDMDIDALFNGKSVFHRILRHVNASTEGMIRVSATNLTGHPIARLVAIDVNSNQRYTTEDQKIFPTTDRSQLPTTIAVPPGTYRLEAQVLNEGADQWIFYSSSNVTVTAGQITDAPPFDANETVPATVVNKATYQGLPLGLWQVQLRPVGTIGRAYQSTDGSKNLRVSPGTYDVLYALKQSKNQPQNHVFTALQRNVDITRGLTIADDFGDQGYAALHVVARDGENKPAALQVELNPDFTVEWLAADLGETFVHVPDGDYDTPILFQGAWGGPAFWVDHAFSIHGDQTLNLGGPLTETVSGLDIAPGRKATIRTQFLDAFGNHISSILGGDMTILVKGVHGEEVARVTTSDASTNTIDIPASAPYPLRVLSWLDATGYTDFPVVAESIFGAGGFSDTGTVPWAETDITVLAARGVVKGTGALTFNPAGTVTRAEFATFLVRSLDLQPEASTGRFRDVAADTWYDGCVGAAARANLLRETAGAFRPNDPITREEMADMMARALTFKGKADNLTGVSLDYYLKDYADGGTVDDWAKESMVQAIWAGLLRGRDGNRLAPLATATRAEAVVILKRLLVYTGDL